MNCIEYKVENIKKYELDIWSGEYCSSLANIKIYDSSIFWNKEGCINLLDYIKTNRRSGVTDSFSRMLAATRKIIEGVIVATDYLISENSISLSLDKIWFDSEKDIVKLLPEYEEGEFLDRLCNMLRQIKGDKIADKIIEMNRSSAFSYKELLRFLSSWELELR